MKTIWSWVNAHWLKTLLIALGIILALVIPPFVVHWMFKTPARNTFFEQTWGPGDLITYIAGFEAFIGTVYLGTIAVKQNKRNIDINDRLLKIEEISSRFQRSPSLKVESLSVTRTSIDKMASIDGIKFWRQDLETEFNSKPNIIQEPLCHFSFVLKNLSNFNVTIHIESLELHSWLRERAPILYETTDLGLQSNYNVIAPEQSIQLGFMAFDFDLEAFIICDAIMNIIIQNNVNDEFIYTVEFQILVNPPNHHFRIRNEKTLPM